MTNRKAKSWWFDSSQKKNFTPYFFSNLCSVETLKKFLMGVLKSSEDRTELFEDLLCSYPACLKAVRDTGGQRKNFLTGAIKSHFKWAFQWHIAKHSSACQTCSDPFAKDSVQLLYYTLHPVQILRNRVHSWYS